MNTALSDLLTLGNLSAFLAVVATLIGFWKVRQEELRHSDVHSWALRAIAALQKISLRMSGAAETFGAPDHIMSQQAEEVSVLIEQGRLYFRNVPGKGRLRGFGSDKAPAYRGMRPVVLDDLVCVFEAATVWQNGGHDPETLSQAVDHSRARFVSLMQAEVGRSRTRSRKAVTMGEGSPLDNYIDTPE